MKEPDFNKFDNLSSVQKIQEWSEECYIECRSTYLPQVCTYLPFVPETTGRKICVDIGANVGGFCLYIHKKFDEIYAFEPCFENYVILESVLEANEIKNVTAFNNAVHSEDNKILNLYKHNNNCSGDIICQSELTEGQKKEFVPLEQACETVTLTGIIDHLNLPYIDYLKVDCEGGEYEIFKNFKDYDKIRVMNMEMHGSFEEKLSLIKELEKHYFVVAPHHHLDLIRSGSKNSSDIEKLLDICKNTIGEEEVRSNAIFLFLSKSVFVIEKE